MIVKKMERENGNANSYHGGMASSEAWDFLRSLN